MGPDYRLGLQPSEQAYDGVGKYWAVLVGVGKYEDASYLSLDVCVDDVKAVAKQLTHNGYAARHMRLLVDNSPNSSCYHWEITFLAH